MEIAQNNQDSTLQLPEFPPRLPLNRSSLLLRIYPFLDPTRKSPSGESLKKIWIIRNGFRSSFVANPPNEHRICLIPTVGDLVFELLS
jgi:hypothetical protein